MKVSELAKKLEVAPDTVRFYTRIGLIKPVIDETNGYKHYDRKEQGRLRFILSARHLGFTVKDIKRILQESDQNKNSCPLVRKLIEEKLKETELQFKEAQALRGRMQKAIEDWKDKPEQEPSSEMVCHLIEGFSFFHGKELWDE
ncbi:MerR family transcriptional regulator [Aliikangiella sp. G2MR2-5]|uniref:MerR family transcriptional regulator n=1 Tax=Aliikangiella sp. G2MR2-5 TaxID=2788943 RepID=UPI0018A8E588|nr:MerR family transcriptional regulator [Aliikangiella sp. G2MR2-5]